MTAAAPSAPRSGLAAVVRRGGRIAANGVRRSMGAIRRATAALVSIVRPLIALVVALVRPAAAVVSPAGAAAIALAAGALIVGYALAWQELTYLGITVGVALVACVVYLFGRTTYRVSIELSPPRVVVGERAFGRLLVANSGTASLLGARMELPVGTGTAEFAIPGLKPGEEHDELFAVPTQRRAVIIAGPARSVRGDQLGLLRRRVRWTDPVELFVHPVTVPLAPSAAGLVRDLEGQVTKKITNNDLSFHALRAYEPGDDRRYVHWRTSARTGQLMVRQFEETRRSQLTIAHSEFTGHYASDDEFELAVSATASIATQVIRDGTQMTVVTESRRLHSHTPSALLDDSCRIERRPKKYEDPRAFVRDVTRRLPSPSVLIVVAGSAMSAADFHSIEYLYPGDVTLVGIRVDEGASPALKPVSRFLVATIGQLSDLPKVLRRMAL